MRKTGHVGLDEPFAGLFTQGMVVHETYRNANGEWLPPAEVRVEGEGSGRRAYAKEGGEELVIGAIEKMSKSKRNTVDPSDIIESYGADTARWFMLSDSPPERDVIWTEAGVEGAHRYVQRVWRLVTRLAAELPPPRLPRPPFFTDDSIALRRHVHRTVDAVTNDIARLRFNRAVAQLYELTNVLSAATDRLSTGTPDFGWALREGAEALAVMLAPMMPHLAEECWRALGHEKLAAETAWPEAEPELLRADTITLPVQVNGKKRGELTVAVDAPNGDVEKAALALEPVRRILEGRQPKKVVVVPNRIVNVVA
jgi:leucyl-tRNA synthetase